MRSKSSSGGEYYTDFSAKRHPRSSGSADVFSSLLQYAFSLGRMGRDRVHQRRTQAIVRLELELFQTSAHLTHALRLEAGFNDGGYERGECGSGPATLLRQLGVHEIETVERVVLVLDAAIHVDAATRARMTLNSCGRVDDLELLFIGSDLDLVLANNRDLREHGAVRLPALRATTDVVMGDVTPEADGDLLGRALARKRAAGDAGARLDPI